MDFPVYSSPNSFLQSMRNDLKGITNNSQTSNFINISLLERAKVMLNVSGEARCSPIRSAIAKSLGLFMDVYVDTLLERDHRTK